MPAAFRFAAKKVLLTYSDVCEEVTKEAILFDLKDRYPIIHYALGEELHPSTGGRHIHAVFEFSRRVDSIDPRLFDIADSIHQHHPNIKAVKHGQANWDRAYEYVCKEDPTPETNVQPKLTYSEMFEQADNADDFMRLVLRNYPRDYALNYDRLSAMAKAHWKKFCANTITTTRETSNTRTPFDLRTLNLQSVIEAKKSLVIVGPPGIGKTTWATEVAPKPSLFIRHLDSLSKLQREHQSIIFDDLDFKHLPPSTQKFLVDTEQISEIHIRYRVATIPANIPRIFTSNEFPFLEEGVHGAAIERRIHLVNL